MQRDISAAWNLATKSRGPVVAARSFLIARAAIKERGALQRFREFAPFIAFVSRRPLATIVEIGSSRGGTFYAWCAIADPDALIVGIDFPGGAFGEFSEQSVDLIGGYKRERQIPYVISGDSHAPETLARLRAILDGREIDLLFIDGDHTYEGVRADFENYRDLVMDGLIAFHDIVPGESRRVGGVPEFWAEIKREFRHMELVEGWGQNGYGIGVLFAAGSALLERPGSVLG